VTAAENRAHVTRLAQSVAMGTRKEPKTVGGKKTGGNKNH